MTTLSKRVRKRKRSSFLQNTAVIVFALFFTGMFAYQIIKFLPKYNKSEEKLQTAQETLESFTFEKDILKENIHVLETLEGQERAIRDRFNVVKDGEGVIYIVEDVPAPALLEDSEEEEQLLSPWARLRAFVGF